LEQIGQSLDKIFLALVPGLMLLLVLCEISDRHAVRWLSWLAKKKGSAKPVQTGCSEQGLTASLSKLASAVSGHFKSQADQGTSERQGSRR
jgi:hypothetical protein